jgi:hypothetical protein
MMGANAQSISVPPTPVELMQGHKKFYSLLVVNRPFELESSWDFFNVTTFSANNHNEVSRNEFFSTSLISYPVYRNVRVASGVNLNSVVGLNYFSGFQYSRMSGHWLIVLVPGIYFKDKSSFEALALMEFTPPISKRSYTPESMPCTMPALQTGNITEVIIIYDSGYLCGLFPLE